MALYKTRGVVLRRRDLGEADRIVTLLTERFGKVRVVAKGVRKARSRLAGHLEPLNEAEFMLWRREGRDLAIVSGASLLRHHPVLSAHLAAFAAGVFAAELLDRSLEDDEPQPRLYALLHRLLEALRRPEHAPAALLAFTVRAAAALGYAAALDRCAACRGPVEAGGAWLSHAQGGLLCGECAGAASASGERLAPGVMRALKGAAASPPRAADPADATEAVRALDRLLGWHQDRRALKAERMLALLTAGGA